MSVTLNLVAVPILAALAAGTGAVATFVTASPAPTTMASTQSASPDAPAATSPVATPVAMPAQAEQPCAAQTWPYIDGKCMTSGQARPKVRMVNAPRSNEMPDEMTGGANAVAAVPQAPAAALRGAPMLTSRDTVLRQPEMLAPKVSKSRDKRSDRRREKRLVVQSYQVPAELNDRRSRAVLVVRPLRLDTFH